MENKNKKILALMIVLTALLIGIGGVFAYKVFSDKVISNSNAHGDNGITCNPGYYLPAEMDRCAPCPRGYYCIGNTYFMSSGDQGKTQCTGSNYQDEQGKADCKSCEGTVSLDHTTCDAVTQKYCSPGYYLPKSSELTNNCLTCLANYYCPGGYLDLRASVDQGKKACDPGTYSPPGAKIEEECIAKKSVTTLSISLDTSVFEYDGKEKKPTVTVKDGNKTLVNDTDYTLSYQNNINAGLATDSNPPTVVVTGKGNYTGTASRTFTIGRTGLLDIPTLTKTKYEYTGEEITPQYSIPSGIPIEVGGISKAANVGEYTIIFKLKDPTKYSWKTSDGSTSDKSDKSFKWKIIPDFASDFTGDKTLVIGTKEVYIISLKTNEKDYTLTWNVSGNTGILQFEGYPGGNTSNAAYSAIKVGENALIQVKYESDSLTEYFTYPVNVIDSLPQCRGIEIESTTNIVAPGDSIQLKANVPSNIINSFEKDKKFSYEWNIPRTNNSVGGLVEGNDTITFTIPETAADGAKYCFDFRIKYNDTTYCDQNSICLTVSKTVKNIPCDQGQYLPKNSETCASCPENSYCPGGLLTKNETKDVGIYSCSEIKGTRGVYSISASGSDAAEKCYANVEDGRYVESGSSIYKCPVGKYKEQHKAYYGSSDKCDDCPIGKSTPDVASVSRDACTVDVETVAACKAGTYLPANTAKCVECPVGSYCPGPVNSSTTKYVKKTYDQGINSCPYANVTNGNSYSVATRKYTSKVGAKSESECYITLNCDRVNMSSPPQILACTEFNVSATSSIVYYGQSGSACATPCRDKPNTTCLPKLNGVKSGSKGSTINLTLSDEKNDSISNYGWSISGPAELGKRTNDSIGIMSIKINSDAKNGDEIIVTASSGNCAATHTIKVVSGGGNDTCYNPTTVNVTTLEVQPEEPNREYKTKFKVDEYTVLKASVTGKSPLCGTNVTWQSLDESIAIISDDDTNDIHKLQSGEIKVIGKKAGRVKIRATAVNGGGYGEIEVEVVKQDEDITCVSPTGITVTANPTNIKIGERTIATAKLTGDGTYCDSKVVWESSDTSVATVDQNGNVTGVGEGAVAITARAVSGGKSDSVIIYVGSSLPDVPQTALGVSTIILIASVLIGAFGLYLFYYLKKKQVNN